MPPSCYWHDVANLQVKNVPAALHRKLRAHAKQRGQTVRDLVLEVLRRTIDDAEFQAHLRTRAPVELGRTAAEALREARDERDGELGA